MKNEIIRHDDAKAHHGNYHHEGRHNFEGRHQHDIGHHGHGARSPHVAQHHPESHHADENTDQSGGRHMHGGRGEGHRGGRGGHFGGPRGRARRGEARYVLLDTLRDGPKHGYEIIKYLEDRTSGEYAPSPGTVYPTMQYLQDLGQVRSDQDAERRVYHLTEAGWAELEARAEDLSAFWSRFGDKATSATSQPEIDFLREELDDLGRTVWGGLRSLVDREDAESVRRVRQAVERCQSEVREIIAYSVSKKPSPEPNAPGGQTVPKDQNNP